MSAPRGHRTCLTFGVQTTVVPVRARGETFGTLAMLNADDRPPHTETEVATSVEVAHRGALSLDNARLFNREQMVAEKLQRSLLTDPSLPDDLELVVRYRPAVSVPTAQAGQRYIWLRGLASTRMTERQRASVADALRALLRASHLLAPDDLAATAAAAARRMGVREMVLYLADYEQATLLPLPGTGVPERQELSIEGTMAGRAFRRVDVITSTATRGVYRLWLPLLDGVERLGVVELVLPAPPGEDREGDLRVFVSLVAELIVVNDAYGDVFSRLRRRRTLSLAAEMQWELLPPMSFGTERLVITGGLEPAYDIGGDSFDYALNGSTADLLVIDAVGHGLPATVLASVAISAYRHARRNALDLPAIAVEINTAIAGQFGASQFATAVLARLDVDSGRLRWINAGHPEPLILRGTSLVRAPRCPPSRPLGLQVTKPVCCEMRLEPGDRLLLYTDGITEARSPTGEFFGEQRLADFIATAVAAGEPPPETVRQLMRHVLSHQADQLQDDASIVLLEWRTGAEAQLRL